MADVELTLVPLTRFESLLQKYKRINLIHIPSKSIMRISKDELKGQTVFNFHIYSPVQDDFVISEAELPQYFDELFNAGYEILISPANISGDIVSSLTAGETKRPWLPPTTIKKLPSTVLQLTTSFVPPREKSALARTSKLFAEHISAETRQCAIKTHDCFDSSELDEKKDPFCKAWCDNRIRHSIQKIAHDVFISKAYKGVQIKGSSVMWGAYQTAVKNEFSIYFTAYFSFNNFPTVRPMIVMGIQQTPTRDVLKEVLKSARNPQDINLIIALEEIASIFDYSDFTHRPKINDPHSHFEIDFYHFATNMNTEEKLANLFSFTLFPLMSADTLLRNIILSQGWMSECLKKIVFRQFKLNLNLGPTAGIDAILHSYENSILILSLQPVLPTEESLLLGSNIVSARMVPDSDKRAILTEIIHWFHKKNNGASRKLELVTSQQKKLVEYRLHFQESSDMQMNVCSFLAMWKNFGIISDTAQEFTLFKPPK